MPLVGDGSQEQRQQITKHVKNNKLFFNHDYSSVFFLETLKIFIQL